MAETAAGKAALQALAEDDQVMLSILVDCVGEAHGQALGAAAVEVTKVLPWDGLAGWLGEDTLVRRIGELRAPSRPTAGRSVRTSGQRCTSPPTTQTATDRGRPGSRPRGGQPRLVTVASSATDGEFMDVVDEAAVLDPEHMGEGYAVDDA